jgi:hypothetical protein
MISNEDFSVLFRSEAAKYKTDKSQKAFMKGVIWALDIMKQNVDAVVTVAEIKRNINDKL